MAVHLTAYGTVRKVFFSSLSLSLSLSLSFLLSLPTSLRVELSARCILPGGGGGGGGGLQWGPPRLLHQQAENRYWICEIYHKN